MIVAGFGFRAEATQASLADALGRAGFVVVPEVFATLDSKAETLRPFAAQQRAALHLIHLRQAQSCQTLTSSTASRAATGLASVAEACALVAAGPGGRLLGPRVISSDKMATCAIAVGGNRR